MPSNVARFEQLMYLSLGIGVIISVLQFSYFESRTGAGFVLLVQAIVLAVFVLFIWLIARRRANWARWTLLVMFLLGLILFVPIVRETLQRSPLVAGLNITQLALQAVALYLVFTGNAVDWFKSRQR